jgi:hypothetical protein
MMKQIWVNQPLLSTVIDFLCVCHTHFGFMKPYCTLRTWFNIWDKKCILNIKTLSHSEITELHKQSYIKYFNILLILISYIQPSVWSIASDGGFMKLKRVRQINKQITNTCGKSAWFIQLLYWSTARYNVS